MFYNSDIRVYIAAPYNCKQEAKQLEKYLLDRNIEVMSKWHNQEPMLDQRKAAMLDLDDLGQANTLILLELPDGQGGKDREFGWALHAGYALIVVSEQGPNCVFDNLDEVVVVENTYDAAVYVASL